MAFSCSKCGGNLLMVSGKLFCPICRNFVSSNSNGSLSSLKSSPLKQMSGEDLFEKVRPGVVELETETSRGSGFVLSDRFILTCAHCVTDSKGYIVSSLDVKFENGFGKAKPICVGTQTKVKSKQVDLAVIELQQRIPIDAKILKLADYSTVKNAQTIYAIGNARGLGICITRGIVSDRLREAEDGRTHMLIDCNAFHGNSGCPILNDDGEVIGILDQGFDEYDNGVNYAIPSCIAIDFLKQNGIRV